LMTPMLEGVLSKVTSVSAVADTKVAPPATSPPVQT
jgi:hypothetical protein